MTGRRSVKIDLKANTFGLPPSLRIPVAAFALSAIEEFVGCIVATEVSRKTGRVNAAKVQTATRPKEPNRIPLWQHSDAARFESILYPSLQLWVYVDFDGYRRAWRRMGMPEVPTDYMLDHIANRKATRLRGYLHPYIRLCPVSRTVNSNAGHRRGGEGMERGYIESIQRLPDVERNRALDRMKSQIVYADPMDLTKMLGFAPGTFILNGVRDLQQLLFPA